MISIVIPHYDDWAILAEHLPRYEKLLKESKLEHEILVVDDASLEDTVNKLQELAKKFPEVKFIFENNNEGFGPTVDTGIRAARGEFVFLLKNDVFPERADFFSLMLAHFRDPKVFSVASALETVEGGKKENRGQGEIYFERGFFLHRRAESPSTRFANASLAQDSRTSKVVYHSGWADGGAQVIRKEYYEKIGGFDSIYRFYWEDVDLGYRAWKAGYEIHFEPKAILKHEYTEGSIAKRFGNGYIWQLNQRNQFIFTWKNGDFRHLLSAKLWLPYHTLIALKNGNWAFFRAFGQALFCGPQILLKRWEQRKVSIKSDNEVLGIVSGENAEPEV